MCWPKVLGHVSQQASPCLCPNTRPSSRRYAASSMIRLSRYRMSFRILACACFGKPSRSTGSTGTFRPQASTCTCARCLKRREAGSTRCLTEIHKLQLNAEVLIFQCLDGSLQVIAGFATHAHLIIHDLRLDFQLKRFDARYNLPALFSRDTLGNGHHLTNVSAGGLFHLTKLQGPYSNAPADDFAF